MAGTLEMAAKSMHIHSGLGLAFTLLLGLAASASLSAEATSERQVGQYLVRVTLDTGELRRSIYPRFRTELSTRGDDGIVRKLSLPVELYSEIRTYQPEAGDQAGASYERAYTRMVEAGDCRPVGAGFREASFDCGTAKGYRTVAVHQDALGTYFSWESTATGLIPDRSAFESARSALDDLTTELIGQALQAPSGNGR